MTWNDAADIATTIAGVIAVAGVIAGYFTYRQSVKTRRAEWLASLHEKFFESNRYGRIERLLDYRQEPELTELSNAVETGTYSELASEFYGYLNFLELLAGLHQLGQISESEILGLFEYDLRVLTKHSFVMNCLVPQGFERLPELLKRTGLIVVRS